MVYCDTSLLVSILAVEVNSIRARSWYFDMPRRPCSISDWTITEVASAIAQKHRSGVIGDDYRLGIEAAWAALKAELTTIPVTHAHFRHATELVDSAPRGLRAGDALHMAIALDQGCDLATFDRDLAEAARAMGVAVHPA